MGACASRELIDFKAVVEINVLGDWRGMKVCKGGDSFSTAGEAFMEADKKAACANVSDQDDD